MYRETPFIAHPRTFRPYTKNKPERLRCALQVCSLLKVGQTKQFTFCFYACSFLVFFYVCGWTFYVFSFSYHLA